MNNQIFYINTFNYIKSEDDIDVKKVPSIIRRKLDLLDKSAITTMSKAYYENVEEIIFSSGRGETSRLKEIIEQYKELNEVSPTKFSTSVHNYIVGFFNLYKKLNIPYSAIASGENSISAGLVKSVISFNKNVLFCYADVDDGVPKSISCVISKIPDKNSIKCSFNQNAKELNKDEFKDFVNLLENKTKFFKSNLCEIERLN